APRSGLRSTSVFSKTNEACTEAAIEKQRLENKRRLPFMREAKRRTLAVSIKLIYFDDGHAGDAVCATNDGRIGPGQERRDNGRFRVARRRHARVEDCGLLRRSPVVIRSEERSAGITHFQSWIRHRALDGQRRSDRTNNHVRPRLPDHNNSADQDVIVSLHERASRDVGQLRSRGGLQVVNFYNGGAGYLVRVAYDRRVRPGREAHQDRGFICMSRSNPAGGDRPAVRTLPPIVVEADHGAGRVVQFENWIENFPRQRKRWSDGSNNYLFALRPGDDEAAD